MKKIVPIIIIAFIFLLGGCIKNKPVIVQDRLAEFDATSWNANFVGVTYPVLGRIPPYGRVANSSDSTIRRYPQSIKIRVNLNGPQSTKDETVGYDIFTSPTTVFSMPATGSCAPANFPATCPSGPYAQTPAAAGATLTVRDAVAGTHFTALSGTVTIPANSSFGYIDLQILNPGATAGEGRFIGFTLNNKGSIPASINYSQLGLVIDQR